MAVNLDEFWSHGKTSNQSLIIECKYPITENHVHVFKTGSSRFVIYLSPVCYISPLVPCCNVLDFFSIWVCPQPAQTFNPTPNHNYLSLFKHVTAL